MRDKSQGSKTRTLVIQVFNMYGSSELSFQRLFLKFPKTILVETKGDIELHITLKQLLHTPFHGFGI